MEVLRIKAVDTHPLRHKMLRPNGTLDDCVFQGDNDELTFHLGAFVDKKLVSVASFYFERNEKFPDANQFRLRGMATSPEYQGRGLSSALLRTAFPVIKQNQCTLLWCNAREKAMGFYTKVGFKPVGEHFSIPNIGKHILMYIPIE
ncbi:MAG: GNAT family N-acetyltransferase [Bacteriovoracaceae bacterium]